MAELFRSRDCTVFFKDDAYTVTVDAALVSLGWPGGQGVQFVGSVGSADDLAVVSFSRGFFGGFLVWGSDEAGDDFTAMARNQPQYQFATMMSGSALIATSSYERFTIASRLVPPLVPLIYTVDEPLYLSLRGLWTNEDELTIIGDPSAPAVMAGFVTQRPREDNNFFLSIQTMM